MKNFVEVGRNTQYRIHATERSRPKYGAIVSKTFLEQFDAVVTIYANGAVTIEAPKVGVEYNLRTGQLQAIGSGTEGAAP